MASLWAPCRGRRHSRRMVVPPGESFVESVDEVVRTFEGIDSTDLRMKVHSELSSSATNTESPSNLVTKLMERTS